MFHVWSLQGKPSKISKFETLFITFNWHDFILRQNIFDLLDLDPLCETNLFFFGRIPLNLRLFMSWEESNNFVWSNCYHVSTCHQDHSPRSNTRQDTLPWWRWRSEPCHDHRSSCWGLSRSSRVSCTPGLIWWTSWPCSTDSQLSWAGLRGCWLQFHSAGDTPSLVSEWGGWPRSWMMLPRTLVPPCTTPDTRTETSYEWCSRSLLCSPHLSASQTQLVLKWKKML